MAVGYKRIDKENHISLVFYFLYAIGLSFGINAEIKANTADGCEKVTIKNIGKIKRRMHRTIEYQFIETFLSYTLGIYSE